MANRKAEPPKKTAAKLRLEMEELNRKINKGGENILLADAVDVPRLSAILSEWKERRVKLSQDLENITKGKTKTAKQEFPILVVLEQLKNGFREASPEHDWRRELDLPPIKKVTRFWNSRNGVICLFPEWFCPPQNDWPGSLIQTDFPLWNDRSGQGLAEEVQNFLDQGEPPLVFTPGSTNLHGQKFFLSAVEACQKLDRRGIFLTDYPDQLPSPLPETIAHFSHVPLDLLLPQSAAFIHHGGIGSTSQGMAAGIPQVLMPLAHDQFDNAERVKNLGVGDWIVERRFTGPRLARKLKDLLESEAVAAACRDVAEKLTPRNGLSRAAEAIEEKVGETGFVSSEQLM